MQLTHNDIALIQAALGYAIICTHTENELRAFSELRLKIDKERLKEIGKYLEPESKPPLEWVEFNFIDVLSRPKEYGKYLICRKDGKIHWETWNGSGWAYNHNEIRYWAIITNPIL